MKSFNLLIFQSFNSKNGFTIAELLITIAISAILTSAVFASSYSVREQFSLFQEQYHLFNALNETKNLTLAFYSRQIATDCGYGIKFQSDAETNESKVIIYKDKVETGEIGDSCKSLSHKFYYNAGDEIVDEKTFKVVLAGQNYSFKLSETVKFADDTDIDVLFIAPIPTVYISQNGAPLSTGNEINIPLETIKGGSTGSTAGVKINTFGQISMYE